MYAITDKIYRREVVVSPKRKVTFFMKKNNFEAFIVPFLMAFIPILFGFYVLFCGYPF